MARTQAERAVEESTVLMTEIVLPEDSNPRGSVFGGRVLSLIDKCAAIAAIRHARSETATVSMDSVVFLNKVRVGDVLLLRGRLNAAFRSSMEVEVEVHAEDPRSGTRRLTTRALVTMVAVDETGRPRAVPRLRLNDDDQRRRAAAAARRRRTRLRARPR
jgi:acyl-CoA hydrolase